jgi:hypothetical protein
MFVAITDVKPNEVPLLSQCWQPAAREGRQGMNISETDLWQAAAALKAQMAGKSQVVLACEAYLCEDFRTISVRAYTADGGEYVTLIELPHAIGTKKQIIGILQQRGAARLKLVWV